MSSLGNNQRKLRKGIISILQNNPTTNHESSNAYVSIFSKKNPLFSRILNKNNRFFLRSFQNEELSMGLIIRYIISHLQSKMKLQGEN